MRLSIMDRLSEHCDMDAVLIRKDTRDETFGTIIKNEPENIKCYKYGDIKYVGSGSDYKLVNMNHYILPASLNIKPEDTLDGQIVRTVTEYNIPKTRRNTGSIQLVDCICY